MHVPTGRLTAGCNTAQRTRNVQMQCIEQHITLIADGGPPRYRMLGGHDLVCDLIRSFGGRLELEHAPKALGQAASAGDIRRISLLVENGVPVDLPDFDGRTALHLAATEGQLLSVYILLHRSDTMTPAE